ncbi:hypothetical protein H072_7950 [Dactylellina haptotyla CBS 200.50]|uniref:Uncharacterized protein n=1 Tax=Dactylellina haptotyla (strain CBS 200.50) TaxID=1284197 RepID=S8BT39_DACHA|nr:hypothetical protein H072_7950 [Dactylellina haptotyla CBS 200.50]
MVEGQVVYKDNLDGEWFAYGDTVDVRDFDADLAYASDMDYTFRSGDDDDSRTVSTNVGLDRSGDEWDLEFAGPYPVSFGPGLEPDIQVPYGTRWAPGQMVPDWEVYRSDYRDWRNWMISEGNYRGLSSDFTDRYTYDQLRRMGYLIDEPREMAIRRRKAEVQELAREAEGGYEQIRGAERAIRGEPALDLNSEYMQNLFQISTPDGGSASLDPLATLMDIQVDELQAGEVVASPSNIAGPSVMELEEELPQDGNHMQSLFEDVLGQDSRPDQPDSNL